MSCQGETGRGAFWVALCSAEARASAGICLLLFRRQLGGGLGLAYGNHVHVRPSKDYKYMQARRSSRTTHGVILVEARVSWGFGPQEDHGYPMYQRACLLSCPSFHENETDH